MKFQATQGLITVFLNFFTFKPFHNIIFEALCKALSTAAGVISNDFCNLLGVMNKRTVKATQCALTVFFLTKPNCY
ncbi:hypothetical protein A9P44_21270 [Paenibacillus polymyxa]|nr:hypothetical protein A9P44_21270 [Paenibacillus polymyxa]